MKFSLCLFAGLAASTLQAQVSETATAIFPFNGNTTDLVEGVVPESGSGYTFVDDREGNPESAIQLNAPLDYGPAAFSAIGDSDYSISIWFRKDASLWQISSILEKTASGDGSVISEGYAIRVQDWIGLTATAYSTLRSGLSGMTSNGFIGDVSDLSVAGDWHHLLVVVDRDGFMTTFIDNVQSVETDVLAHVNASEVVDTAPFVLGGGNMTLDDLYFFDYAIGEEERDELFNGTSTSVIETQHTAALSAYPNPVLSTLTIGNGAGSTEVFAATVTTLDGRHVANAQGTLPMQVNTAEWPAGCYLVSVQGAEQSRVLRVVKR